MSHQDEELIPTHPRRENVKRSGSEHKLPELELPPLLEPLEPDLDPFSIPPLTADPHPLTASPAGEVIIRHKAKRAVTAPVRVTPIELNPLEDIIAHVEAEPLVAQPPELAPAPVKQKRRAVIQTDEPHARRPVSATPNQGDILLYTKDLKKVYDGRAVVNGVDVNVRHSEIVGLLGPNGAGKTTSFYMIVGLVQPNGGKVVFNGKEATNEPMYKRARMGMGYLPQEESIFRKMTVEENILSVMEAQGLGRSERRDKCNALMKQFGIEKLAKNIAITLSGGEKRRLTIARSLVTNPTLLMLDEPFSGVDPIAVGEIQEIIGSLREQGLAILITDHNVRETLGIVDRAYLMFEGTVKREGTRDFLINDPLSRKLYLGEDFTM
jgi:lipopolysaccharide export system ATP-binding protein